MTDSMLTFEYRGNRANSAAIQPRLRTIARITALRRPSSQSGKASRKLNSAVRCNFGNASYIAAAIKAARPRAMPRGIAPSAFKITQTAAYSSHSFIVCRRRNNAADARQYACSGSPLATSNQDSSRAPAYGRFSRLLAPPRFLQVPLDPASPGLLLSCRARLAPWRQSRPHPHLPAPEN
jgi:hypothetical protein